MIPDEWLTHFERSGYSSSPRYDETIEYFARLSRSTPHARMFTFGSSAQGRELYCFVAGKGRVRTPKAARRSGKAVVMIQNGIHAGEIDGKDAWMLLLREILVTKEKEHLLDNLVLLIIPILNVDGHELVSPHNRPNQNGPAEMGWRTTAHNLNLNRDYMKADAPEMRALLRLFSTWLPDFLIDNHTTNGVDYQYHVSYLMETQQNIDAGLASWTREWFLPEIIARVEHEGFLTAPLPEFDGGSPTEGIRLVPTLPRMSNGYTALQNRPSLLVESHSLKPFANRVFSTKAMNVAALELLNGHSQELKQMNKRADSETVREFYLERKPLPIQFRLTEVSEPFLFKGIGVREEVSPITDAPVSRYTGEPAEFEVPLYRTAEVEEAIVLPHAYVIPVEFTSLVKILRLHGIRVEKLGEPKVVSVERYRLSNISHAPGPYEGRQRTTCTVEPFVETVALRNGSYVISCRQRALRVIVNLLEPAAPDSLLQWGFFNAFLERKEYAEPFIIEPIAQEMLAHDPALGREFKEQLESNEEFRSAPSARLDFFYTRSPYRDRLENLYPVMRLLDDSISSA